MSELARVVAYVFRLLGKERLGRNEFKQALSFRLNWYPPAQASQLLERALSHGLLVAEGDQVRCGFDLAEVDLPLHFRGSEAALREAPAAPAPAPDEAAVAERAAALRGMARGRLSEEAARLLARRERGHEVAAEAARALAGLGVGPAVRRDQRSQADVAMDRTV
ncbi:MAG TPA: DUF2240 family protein [Candidatus Thermoplasmatota archaeon]|nr:DUF2240 family protein [Candidatus Thermoplasmatota archaeon]